MRVWYFSEIAYHAACEEGLRSSVSDLQEPNLRWRDWIRTSSTRAL